MHSVNLDIKYLSPRSTSFGGGVFSTSRRRPRRPEPPRPFSAQVIAEVLGWLRDNPERHIQIGASRNYVPVLNYIMNSNLFDNQVIVAQLIREIRAFQESPQEYNRVRRIRIEAEQQTARLNNPLLAEQEEDTLLDFIRDTERMQGIEGRHGDPRRRIITQSQPSTIRPQRKRTL